MQHSIVSLGTAVGSGIYAADMDGDGVTEIISGTSGAGKLSLYKWDPNTAAWVEIVLDSTSASYGRCLVVDLDLSGAYDVVCPVDGATSESRLVPPAGTGGSNMLIGIFSDTHDQLIAIDRALEVFRQRKVDFVIHGGDLISPFAAKRLKAGVTVPLYIIYGNNDGERDGLKKILPQIQDGPMFIEAAARPSPSTMTRPCCRPTRSRRPTSSWSATPTTGRWKRGMANCS